MHVRDEPFVRCGRSQSILRNRPEHEDRVVVTRFPEVAIEALKKPFNLVVPIPVKVLCEFTKRLKTFGDGRRDVELKYRLHVVFFSLSLNAALVNGIVKVKRSAINLIAQTQRPIAYK
jgi:hypothetical protein